MFSSSLSFPIGLDISDLSIKLVQLHKKGGKLKIQALNKINIKEGLIVDGEIKNQTALAKQLRLLVDNPKYGKITTSKVVACLPEPKTFIKLIKVLRTPNNLSDIIETEIEKNIPFSLDEIYYDWQIIEDKKDHLLILIGAALKETADQYISLFNEAKLSVEALEIEPLAICRALLVEESPKFKESSINNYAIINIGAVRTSMIIYSKNTILFTAKIPMSGNQITSTISKELEIEEDQAEKVKLVCGFKKDIAQGVVYKILSEDLKNLNKKISSVLDFYNDHFSKRGPLSQILLSGGGANTNDVENVIREFTSVKVDKGDILTNLAEDKEAFSKLLSEKFNIRLDFDKNISGSVKKKIKKDRISITQDSSLTYATAVGLALRKVFIK